MVLGCKIRVWEREGDKFKWESQIRFTAPHTVMVAACIHGVLGAKRGGCRIRTPMVMFGWAPTTTLPGQACGAAL